MTTNRRNFMKYSMGGIGAGMLSANKTLSAAVKKHKSKNVLFIIVEDLKNIMGCYGNPLVKTPNLDKLAKKGVVFDRAYCQYPVCNPSRTSFLTGLRPDTTKVLDNVVPWNTHVPKDHPTLPKLFKDNGYHTISMGKIFHGKGKHDDKEAWDIIKDFSQTPLGKQGEGRNMTGGNVKWCKWLAAKGTDLDQPDGQLAAATVDILRKEHDKPFFMALGIHKPHDPFEAPKKYFDMYPLDTLMPPVNPDNKSPKPEFVIGSGWAHDFKKFTIREQREFLRAYYAGTSFADAQIGKIMDELDRQKLWKDTVVIFIGDHGYNLGEYDWWNKAVVFEDSCRVPMIAVVEGETRENSRCDQFVELVDLYPTFADLCGIKPPDNLEGKSFRPILKNLDIPWKKTAYTQVQRGSIKGMSVRTKRWRYNEWTKNGKAIFRELFDHASDPQEFRNLAELSGFKGTCDMLSKKIAELK